MDKVDILEKMQETGLTASELVDEINPKLVRKFEKACNKMMKVLTKIQKEYPEANILIADEKPHLLLGSHIGEDGRKMIVSEGGGWIEGNISTGRFD